MEYWDETHTNRVTFGYFRKHLLHNQYSLPYKHWKLYDEVNQEIGYREIMHIPRTEKQHAMWEN